jgi:hypothetical protein
MAVTRPQLGQRARTVRARVHLPVVGHLRWKDGRRATFPSTRAECEPGVGHRPCPWVRCRHHLYLEVVRRGGVKFLFGEGRELEDLPDTCSLDVAEAGPQMLSAIATRMNLVDERVRQVFEEALESFAQAGGAELGAELLGRRVPRQEAGQPTPVPRPGLGGRAAAGRGPTEPGGARETPPVNDDDEGGPT